MFPEQVLCTARRDWTQSATAGVLPTVFIGFWFHAMKSPAANDEHVAALNVMKTGLTFDIRSLYEAA